MITIRLTLAILLLAGLVTASPGYEAVDPADFVTRAATYEGRLLALSGEIRAVNADGNSFRLFDPESKALIDVSLVQLSKQQRRALMMSPIRLVSVNGRAVLVDGKMVIEAHRVISWHR
jgi:hypothetical protein